MNPLLRFAADVCCSRGWSLLPIRHNKHPACAWKPLQAQPADVATVRGWLDRAHVHGLGVLCGRPSGGLVVRDWDIPGAYEAWAERHPEYAGTLPTAATPRGMHVYCRGDLDRIVHLADGECRGAGYVVMPPSKLSAGLYRWLRAPGSQPLPQVDLVAAGLLPAGSVREWDTGNVRGDSSLTITCVPSLDAAIQATVPGGPGQRHWALLRFARMLRSVPGWVNAGEADLMDAVARWLAAAGPNVRTRRLDVSWREFSHAWAHVRVPWGVGGAGEAYAASLAVPEPAIARRYRLAGMRRLVGLCAELQRRMGGKAFYLSARTVAGLLGVARMTANRWLRRLVADGVLTVERPGERWGRATEYRMGHR